MEKPENSAVGGGVARLAVRCSIDFLTARAIVEPLALQAHICICMYVLDALMKMARYYDVIRSYATRA